jgi:hypothetical protein
LPADWRGASGFSWCSCHRQPNAKPRAEFRLFNKWKETTIWRRYRSTGERPLPPSRRASSSPGGSQTHRNRAQPLAQITAARGDGGVAVSSSFFIASRGIASVPRHRNASPAIGQHVLSDEARNDREQLRAAMPRLIFATCDVAQHSLHRGRAVSRACGYVDRNATFSTECLEGGRGVRHGQFSRTSLPVGGQKRRRHHATAGP